jgi:hypothetical protein
MPPPCRSPIVPPAAVQMVSKSEPVPLNRLVACCSAYNLREPALRKTHWGIYHNVCTTASSGMLAGPQADSPLTPPSLTSNLA